MKLSLRQPTLYRVKRGQSLQEIALAFGCTPQLLVARNALTEEPKAGAVLKIPPAGNLYTVRGGESKTLLCGSPARFEELNGTAHFYVGQLVVLG